MMQSMLADRFQLATHRETRTSKVSVLSVAKGGLKRCRASSRSICSSRQSIWDFPGTTRSKARFSKPSASKLA